jgi:hypothetical protein
VEGLAVAVGKVKKADESGPSFDECADRRALVLADDEVSFLTLLRGRQPGVS